MAMIIIMGCTRWAPYVALLNRYGNDADSSFIHITSNVKIGLIFMRVQIAKAMERSPMDCFFQLLLFPVLQSSNLIILLGMVVMITFASNKCFGLVDIDYGGLEGHRYLMIVEIMNIQFF
jgi:hypothetical protein